MSGIIADIQPLRMHAMPSPFTQGSQAVGSALPDLHASITGENTQSLLIFRSLKCPSTEIRSQKINFSDCALYQKKQKENFLGIKVAIVLTGNFNKQM